MRIGVIGGGVYGSSIAYFLTEFGEDVVLLEKGNLGGVSTSKSAGIVRHHYSNRNDWIGDPVPGAERLSDTTTRTETISR